MGGLRANLRDRRQQRPRDATTRHCGQAALLLPARTRAPPRAPTTAAEFVVPAGSGGGADQTRLRKALSPKLMPMKQGWSSSTNRAAGAEDSDVKKLREATAQDRHHPFQSIHNAARHRGSIQLEGFDARRHAGARRIRALGER
jgi:hypothetical protein